MKIQLLVLCAAATPLYGGIDESAGGTSWLLPAVESRLRYEFADIDGFEPSHAMTFRIRPALRLREWHGISALLEGELTEPLIDDFHGGAAGVEPFDPSNSAIADPRNAEINQAYLQFGWNDWTLRLGRQRIVLGDAAFVGNVGWRQNEQTYDAVRFDWEAAGDLTLTYVMMQRVHRIFGAEAEGLASDVPADVHLLDATWRGLEGTTITGYAYLMDFGGGAPVRGWDNDSLGLAVERTIGGCRLRGELALQWEAGPADAGEALYLHVSGSRTIGRHTVSTGLEHLDDGFQTPLATLHAFNGFADAFVAARTAGTHGGLTDMYLSHAVELPDEIKLTLIGHMFGDNGIGTGAGYGLDAVLLKSFSGGASVTAKLGTFKSKDPRFRTTLRASVQLDLGF